MDANELFLQHATNHLAQYRGNFRLFLEAVEERSIPSADDSSIQLSLRRLTRHLKIESIAPAEEVLFCFALIVPGIIRGINPPVACLETERGGFSDKRLEQSAAQLGRLRTALRVARKYFTGISTDPVTAIRELDDRIKTGKLSDDDWINAHAELTDSEANKLAVWAINTLADNNSESDLAEVVLTQLANNRRDGLGDIIAEVFKRNLFWPSSLYRGAPDDVAQTLIKRISKTDGLQLNHLLLALAWTRGETARQAFVEWRRIPPRWAAQLHVPPENYLYDAGWTIDADGQRKELISEACHSLVQITGEAPGETAISCRVPSDQLCPACNGPLAWLFDFTNLPASAFSGRDAAAPRRILCCPHCACFCPAVFTRYETDGTSRWHPATQSDETEPFERGPPSQRKWVSTPRPAFAAAKAFDLSDATSIGGIPMWLQDSQYPQCPDCRSVMTFLAQFDNGSMQPPEEGIYYAFFCGTCRVAAVNYQQT